MVTDDRNDMPADLPVPLRPPRPRRIQLVWSAVQLICGIVIGVGGTLYVMKDRITWTRPEPDPHEMALRILHTMQERYNLTDDQFKRVSELIKGSMDKRWAMGKDFFEKMNAENTRVNEQMRTILTAEQFAAYSEDMKEMAERHKGRRPPFERGPGRGPGGPGGPGNRGPRRPRGDNDGFNMPRQQTDPNYRGFGPGPGPQGDSDRQTFGPGSRAWRPAPERPRRQPGPLVPPDANTPDASSTPPAPQSD